MRKLFLIILTIVFTHNVYAYVDLAIQYTYAKRRIEGEQITGVPDEPGEAITVTEGYAINWAWYMWAYTALELNYSQSNQILTDTRETSTSDSTVVIKGVESTIITIVQGAGIRQSFASQKATIIPSLSIGYAKMITSGKTDYDLDVSGTSTVLSLKRDEETYNSSYASFQLRIRLTQLMGLTFAAKTVMPDFDTKQAENNLTYSAGFSWVF